jgi:hypothetical protein
MNHLLFHKINATKFLGKVTKENKENEKKENYRPQATITSRSAAIPPCVVDDKTSILLIELDETHDKTINSPSPAAKASKSSIRVQS